ncbi:MAG: hypothetical protein HY741_06025 [Chloroflexi bacterium]|nr:hypothetical protein [Chloroflexota bacterium]
MKLDWQDLSEQFLSAFDGWDQEPASELIRIIDLFAHDSHERRELWWYAMALMMEDCEQVWRIGAQALGGRRWLYFRTIGGDEFPLPDTGLSLEQETELRRQVLLGAATRN